MTDTARTRESDSRTVLESQVEAYKRDGFIIIEDVLRGDELLRAQAAFDRAQAVTRLDWEQGGEYYASGTFHGRKYFDIYPLHLLQELHGLRARLASVGPRAGPPRVQGDGRWRGAGDQGPGPEGDAGHGGGRGEGGQRHR